MVKGISNVFVIKKNLMLMKNVIDNCEVIISQYKNLQQLIVILNL